MNTYTNAQCQPGPHGAAGAGWLCEVTGQPVPLAACLECARHRQQQACPFPPTILRALARSLAGEAELVELRTLAAEAGVALLRVTSLLGCTRQAWYGLHGAAPLETPGRHWARLRGTIFHAALESLAGEDAVAEVRLVARLDADRHAGVRAWVSGKIDHYDPLTRTALDYKTINSFGKAMTSLDLPKPQHRRQLWLYSWLLVENGYAPPLAGRVTYMDMHTVLSVDVAMPDAEGLARTREYAVGKARAITEAGPEGPPGDAVEDWLCRYCTHVERCPDAHPKGRGAARNGDVPTGDGRAGK